MSEKGNLENLIQTLQHANNAQELLERIWNDLGPYNNALTPETTRLMQEYFDFDDSE